MDLGLSARGFFATTEGLAERSTSFVPVEALDFAGGDALGVIFGTALMTGFGLGFGLG